MESPYEVLEAIINKRLKELNILEIGLVTNVYPHSSKKDYDNYECDVQLIEGEVIKRVPIATQYIGLTGVPKVGDLVLVAFVRGSSNFPVVIGRLYNDEDRPPVNRENEIVLAPPNLRRIRIRMPGGLRISITGSTVNIKTSKVSIEIDKDGNITIDSEGDIEITGQKKIRLEAQEGIELKSLSIKIESDSELELKSNATGKVEASAVLELKGGIVKIN